MTALAFAAGFLTGLGTVTAIIGLAVANARAEAGTRIEADLEASLPDRYLDPDVPTAIDLLIDFAARNRALIRAYRSEHQP